MPGFAMWATEWWKPVLFIVDVATGAVTTVQANETAAPVGKNGLGNIVVLDRWGGTGNALTTQVRDGYADTVYAADQKGAVWKFDLRSSTPATQTVPVFTTNLVNGKRQPILGGLAAAAGQGGGVMVYFGTGSTHAVAPAGRLKPESSDVIAKPSPNVSPAHCRTVSACSSEPTVRSIVTRLRFRLRCSRNTSRAACPSPGPTSLIGRSLPPSSFQFA